jgi:uncharacterized protein (TIRG00374 family)
MKRGWKAPLASAASLLFTFGFLFALYRSLDTRAVAGALLRADVSWLVVSVGMIVPITFLRAVRFFWVAPAGSLPSVGEAFRLTLAASALNLVLPAKAGDLIKSYFVATRSRTSASVSVAVVVYERLCDLFGLISWCLLAWVLTRPQAPGVPAAFWILLAVVGVACAVLISSELAALPFRALLNRILPHRKFRKLHELADGWPDLLAALHGRRRWVVPFSLVLWLAHLVQIWLFTFALGTPLPFGVSASLSAVALMAGQLPLTVAGVGTRDLALVVLFSRYLSPETAAALGVLVTTRNLIPPLIGIPLMSPYLSTVVVDARRWRKALEAAE